MLKIRDLGKKRRFSSKDVAGLAMSRKKKHEQIRQSNLL